MCKFTASALSALRAEIKATLSPYRFAHTLGVEQAAGKLAALYCPEKAALLSAAALLHDVTKELSPEAHQAVFRAHGVSLRADEAASPKIWHGMTAALEIPARYPAFADPELLSAVRWHTTGRAGMTLTEALLYLADYIEEGRTFPDCVAVRNAFFAPDPARMDFSARRAHLAAVILQSLALTRAELEAAGAPVCRDTVEAEQWLKTGTQPF